MTERTLRVWLHDNGQYVAHVVPWEWQDACDGSWRPTGYGATPAEALQSLFDIFEGAI